MKHDNNPWSLHTLFKDAESRVLKEMNIDPQFYALSDGRIDVLRKIGEIMAFKLSGRVTPNRVISTKSPNKAGLQLLNAGLFVSCYPRKVTTKQQKEKYLSKIRGSIEEQVYNELWRAIE